MSILFCTGPVVKRYYAAPLCGIAICRQTKYCLHKSGTFALLSWACSKVVLRHIRIVEAGVRFPPGPQAQERSSESGVFPHSSRAVRGQARSNPALAGRLPSGPPPGTKMPSGYGRHFCAKIDSGIPRIHVPEKKTKTLARCQRPSFPVDVPFSVLTRSGDRDGEPSREALREVSA